MNRYLGKHLNGALGSLASIVALGLAGTAATVVQLVLLGRIVAGVLLQRQGLAAVGGALAALLGAGVARAALAGVREAVAQRAALDVKATVRARLFAHLLALGPAYCQGERTGELGTTAVEGVERLDGYIARYLPQLALGVLVPLGVAAAVLPLDAASAALLLLTAPVIPLLMMAVGRHAEARVARQWTALARLGAHFLDAVQGLPTLILFDRADAQSERIARVSERLRQRTMDALKIAFLSGMVLEFLTASAIGVVAVELGVRLLDGGIGFERAFVVLLLTPEFYRPLRELGVQRHAGLEGKAALARIVEVLETPVPAAPAAAPAAPAAHTSAPARPRRPDRPLAVALRDVTYTYPGADRPALDGVSFELRPGSGTALVGPSGAGKTTVARLLLRFLDPQGGAILANGVPVGDLAADVWREAVALVPQHPFLFAGSVRDNLRLARPGASGAEIERAAALAGVAELAARLPRGYDTPVGERGARLSAGEIQRLAIARALLKDTPLLILDEPTSSLDPESEALIRRALRSLMRERTVLVVAHRLNTVLAAQQIVVLERGRVAEVGTHVALLEQGGAYARLVGAAAEWAEGAARPVAAEVGA